MSEESEMTKGLKHVRGANVKGKIIHVDGHFFENCQFTDCMLVYGGGEYGFKSTKFPGCKFDFTGPAHGTMMYAKIMGLLLPEVAAQLPDVQWIPKPGFKAG